MPSGQEPTKLDPHQITADRVYKTLNEVRGLAQGIFEQQIVINKKLINDPGDSSDKEKDTVEPPVSERHLPAFKDLAKEIGLRLYHTQKLQEYLLKHI